MRVLLICLISLCSIQLIAQQSTFKVSGKIKGLDSKYIVLIIFNPDLPSGWSRDSIPVENGSFSYTAPITKFMYANINPNIDRVVKRAGSGYYPVKSATFQFFVAPGFDIKFSGKITDFIVCLSIGRAQQQCICQVESYYLSLA